MTAFNELTEPEQRLALALQAKLRGSEELDYVTRARLSAARARALDAARRPARTWLFASSGLTAAVALVAILLWQPHLRGPSGIDASPGSQAEALDVLTDDVDAEFYEDLDLYRWLPGDADGDA